MGEVKTLAKSFNDLNIDALERLQQHNKRATDSRIHLQHIQSEVNIIAQRRELLLIGISQHEN